MLPAGLEERYRDLRRRPALRRQLKAACEESVASVEFGTSYDPWVPRVPLHPLHNRDPGRRVDPPAEADSVAGVDGSGRPVLVRGRQPSSAGELGLRAVYPEEEDDSEVLHVRLLSWLEDRLEIVGLLSSDSVSHVTWVYYDDHGRPVRFAQRGESGNELGKGAELAECEWDGERCTTVRLRILSDTGRTMEVIRIGDYDDTGLVRVRHIAGADESTVWHRATDAWEDDPMPVDQALAGFVEAVGRAVERAVPHAGVPDAFVAKVFVDWQDPVLVLGSAEHLRAARGRIHPPLAILHRLGEQTVGLLGHLDEDGRRALRSLRQLDWWSLRDHRATLDQALEELVRRLDRLDWPGRTDAFLPLLYGRAMDELGEGADGPLRFARRALGDHRVEAFLASLEPPAGARPLPSVRRPPESRDELAGLLDGFALPAALAGQAAWGLALVGGGRGRSRLGGRPDLPVGEGWPTWDGRALTHMATIDLRELPELEGRDLLPADGLLVLFADLTEEGELWEPVVVGEDPRVVLRFVPPGTELHQPSPPEDDRAEYDPPATLRRRRIRFEPVLTLPEVPQGLTPAQMLSYDELIDRLAGVTPGLGDPSHLMLGHPAVVQEDPRMPGQVSLLHLGWDERLGFEFLDAGDLTVYGDERDIRQGRWDRLVVSPASC